MILLPVDEAYALDYLAIAFVKKDHACVARCLPQILNSFPGLWDFMRSDAWRRLVESNQEVFDLVDKAASDKCQASEVVVANLKRWQVKSEIQSAFGTKLTETKV